MFAKDDTILEVDGLCKRYARNNTAARRQLSDMFIRAIAGVGVSRDTHYEGEFWGLQNISFSVKRGAALRWLASMVPEKQACCACSAVRWHLTGGSPDTG